MPLKTYLAVFRSHRVLFLLPVAVAGVLALWIALSAPTMYRSSTTLWSERATGSSSWLSGSLTPAGQDQQLLDELLGTRYFQEVVTRGSPLVQYLEEHPVEGWGPSALVASVRSAPSLNDRIEAALAHVDPIAKSAHVLEVRYDAPTPRLATSTLDVIVRQFIKQREAFRQDALSGAEKGIAATSEALSTARTDLTRYLEAHPASTTRNDPQLKALATAERMAVTALADATVAVNDAAASLSGGSSQTTLRVVDASRLIGPTSGRKRQVTALLGGLFAGALVSGVGIITLAKIGQNKQELSERSSLLATMPDRGGGRQDQERAISVGSSESRAARSRRSSRGKAMTGRSSVADVTTDTTPRGGGKQ